MFGNNSIATEAPPHICLFYIFVWFVFRLCSFAGIVLYLYALYLFQLFNRGHGNLASAAYGKCSFVIYDEIFVILIADADLVDYQNGSISKREVHVLLGHCESYTMKLK